MPEACTPNNGEREFETGTDEQFKFMSQLNTLNAKRTYDEYQDIALTQARRSQIHSDQLNSLAIQAMQNAVETANMVGKQAVKHADVSADAMWNPIQQGASDNLTSGAVVANRAVDAGTAAMVNGTVPINLAVLQQTIQALATQVASIANVLNQSQPKTT